MNLLLNRASPWIDVDSYLPYEGRVQLKNKTANSVAVRIPGWVKIDAVTCTVGGGQVRPRRAGRYLTFESLRPGDVVELRFGVPESRTEYLINYEPYKISFRGEHRGRCRPPKRERSFLSAVSTSPYDKGPRSNSEAAAFRLVTEFSEAD